MTWKNKKYVTSSNLAKYRCILSKLGISKFYPKEYTRFLNLTPFNVILGEPESILWGDISGETRHKEGRIYIANAGLEGILENIIHEIKHLVDNSGAADDWGRGTARKAGEKVMALIRTQKSRTVAIYYCCKKPISGDENRIYSIPVSGWDYILNQCGIDTNDCSKGKNSTHLTTEFPPGSMTNKQKQNIECKCKGL